MTDAVGESLSALLDGEAGELDLKRVLKEMETDESVRLRWYRYHQAAAVMGNEPLSFSHIDISQRVWQQLQYEAAPGVARWRGMLKPMASVAVAATVTAAVLTGTQLYREAQPLQSGAAAETAQLAEAVPFDNADAPVIASQFQELGLRASTGSEPVQLHPRNLPGAQRPWGDTGILLDNRSEADILAEQRLEMYLQNHVQNASFNSGVSLLPYARVPTPKEE
jgi:sigma-E factor negative regulatory protein RseA